MSCIRVLLKVPSMSCTTHAYTHGLRQNTMTFKKSCHTEGKRCHFNSTVQVKSCTIQHQSAWKTLGPPWQPVVTHGHPWPMAGGRDPGRPSVPSPSAVAPPWSDSSHPSASATPEPTGPLYVWLHHWTCKKVEISDQQKKSELAVWYNLAVCQNLVPLVNLKIAGKWMFIPLKMVLIGIDP